MLLLTTFGSSLYPFSFSPSLSLLTPLVSPNSLGQISLIYQLLLSVSLVLILLI